MNSLKYILIPIVVAVLSQLIKVIIETIKNKKLNIIRFFDGMGGMPSTHCALVTSITTLIYLNYKIEDPLFSVTLIFSLVVIYDAMGIRYESGMQAKIINEMTGSELEEKIGHKPIEVLIGVLLGIIYSLIVNIIFY